MNFREYLNKFDNDYTMKKLGENDSFDDDDDEELRRKRDKETLKRYGKLAVDTLWTTPAANAYAYAQSGGQQGLKNLSHRFPGEEIAVGANAWQRGGFNPYSYDNRRRARERLGAGHTHDSEVPRDLVDRMPFNQPSFHVDSSGNEVIRIATQHLDGPRLGSELRMQRDTLYKMPELDRFKNSMVISGITKTKPVAFRGVDGRTYVKVVWSIPFIEH